MPYQIADGFNQTGSLAPVSIQPASEGIHYPRRIYTPAGVYDDGSPFAVWRYNVLQESEYTALLTEFGLSAALTNDVTISTTDAHSRSFVNRNGTICRPENPVYKDGFYRDIEFIIKNLTATS